MKHLTWIFGYGSLVWRPAFEFAQREPAYVRGFARRFWQGSVDHRGVPGSPGRVVTLIRQEQASTWGMAYGLTPAMLEEVLPSLDHREKGGYVHHRMPLHRKNGEIITERGLVYVATEENANYLGPASLSEIARQVHGSVGPSGANREYVLCLAEALRELEVDDPHVFELAALLRQLED